MTLHPLIIKNLQTAPRSLSYLQSITDVSLPTLRKAMQELTDHRWIRVVGQSEANGGRPPMLFGLDDSYYVVIGVHMQLPGLRLILTDLVGQVLDEIETFQGVQPAPDDVLQAIIDYVRDIQKRFRDRKLLGIGIATPGFTDPETGEIISIGRVPGWEHFPICLRLNNTLGLPANIANDVDCMAFAEFRYTNRSFGNNLAYFGLDEGLKVSLFVNGELYKGSFGNTGLIVSQFLRIPDYAISFEDQQQILTLSGLNTIFEREVNTLDAMKRIAYENILQESYRKRLELIFEGALNDLSICKSVVEMLNTVLASAIANVAYIIQPETIVVGGVLSMMPETVFAELSAKMRVHLPLLFANRIDIMRARLATVNSAALGAAFHFMDCHLVTVG